MRKSSDYTIQLLIKYEHGMALAIRGVNNLSRISLSNYSLATQIIIINFLTSIFGLVFLLLTITLLKLNSLTFEGRGRKNYE